MIYEFECQTGKISIKHDRCESCESYACVKACSLYDRGILRVHKGKPVLAISNEEAKKGRCIECLSCEYECLLRGRKALTISLPL